MASLFNQPINGTYNGLLKSSDNGPLGPLTAKVITDGDGNPTPLQLAQEKGIFEVASPGGGTNKLEVNDGGVFIQGDNAFMQDKNAQYFVGASGAYAFLGDSTGNSISADGTKVAYAGNHDFTGATVTGIGGGGTTVSNNANYSTGPGTAGADGPYAFFTNAAIFYPMAMAAGNKISELYVNVTTAFSATTNIGFALYSTLNNDFSVNAESSYGVVLPFEQLYDFGTVDGTTTGNKIITGLNYTLPYTGMYYLAVAIPGTWDGAFDRMTATTSAADWYRAAGIGSYAATSNPCRVLRGTAPLSASYSNSTVWNTSTAVTRVNLKISQ